MAEEAPRQKSVPGKPFTGRGGDHYLPGGAKPGAGRPSSELRAICREAFATRIPKLCAIIDDSESRDADKIAAMAQLSKIGIGDLQENTETQKIEIVCDSTIAKWGQ